MGIRVSTVLNGWTLEHEPNFDGVHVFYPIKRIVFDMRKFYVEITDDSLLLDIYPQKVTEQWNKGT